MKKAMSALLILTFAFLIFSPAPVEAGGNNGWVIGGALLGGFLLGSVLGPRNQVIVGPVYPSYPPPPVYYPPSIYYPPPLAMWIPDHYELRWQTVCEVIYQRYHCYPAQITVFIPGHWEYR